MDFINARSRKVGHRHRLIVISHKRTGVTVCPYQYGERARRTGRYRLTEVDVEPSHIVPVTERMVGKLQRHILRAHRDRHRREGVEIHPAQ